MNRFGCKCDKVKGQSKRRKSSQQPTFKKITHVIFDCEGTLFESVDAYHKILRNLCKKYNKDYTSELQEQCYGGTDHEICVKVCDVLKIPVELDKFEKELGEMCNAELPKAPEKPGVQRLLNHLTKIGVPCAAVSNSKEELINLYKKKRPEIFKYFHHIVSVTEKNVKHGKPAPDIYVLAAQRFDEPKPTPAQCLVFEDSIPGVESGIAAGMQVVITPGHRIPKDKTKTATYVIQNLTHFKPELFGLAPFDDGIAPVP